jgi:hypothetical protein
MDSPTKSNETPYKIFNPHENSDYNNLDLIVNSEYFLQFENFLTCPICLGLIIDPQECSHCLSNYCNTCINRWDGSCPKRCDSLFLTFEKPTKYFIQIIEKVIIRCFRCCESIKYGNFKKHIEGECDKIIVKCLNDNCKVEVEKALLEQHMKSCIYGKRTCEECGSMVYRKDLKNKIEYLQKSNDEKNEMVLKYKQEITEKDRDLEMLKREVESLNQQILDLREIFI